MFVNSYFLHRIQLFFVISIQIYSSFTQILIYATCSLPSAEDQSIYQVLDIYYQKSDKKRQIYKRETAYYKYRQQQKCLQFINTMRRHFIPDLDQPAEQSIFQMRPSNQYRNKFNFLSWQHPRIQCEFVHSFLNCTPSQVLHLFENVNILQMNEEFSWYMKYTTQFSDEGYRGHNIGQKIKDKICIRLCECLKLIHEKGINVECPMQNNFRNALVLVSKNINSVNRNILLQVWQVIQKSSNYQIFKVYLQLLVGLVTQCTYRESPSLQVQDENPRFKKYSSRNTDLQTQKLIKEIIIQFSDLIQLKEYRVKKQKKITILSQANELSSQDQMILLLNVYKIAKMNSKVKDNIILIQTKLCQKIKNQIKLTGSQKLLKFLFKKSDKSMVQGKLCQQIMAYKFDEKQKKFIYSILNEQVCTQKLLNCFAKEYSYRFVYQFLKGSFNIAEEVLYFVFPPQTLFELQLKDIAAYSIAPLLNIREIVMKLIQNKKKPVRYGANNQSMTQYFKGLFRVMVHLIREAYNKGSNENQINQCYNQTFYDFLMQMLIRQDGEKADSKFLNDVIQYLYLQLKKQNPNNKEVVYKLVNQCIILLACGEALITQWRIVNKLKKTIQKWSLVYCSSELKEQNKIYQLLQSIVKKYLEAYFNEACNLSSFNHAFLQIAKPAKQYCQVFSKHMLQKVQELEQNLEKMSLQQLEKQRQVNRFNMYIFKIHNIMGGKFQLTTCLPMAQILNRIYKKYGHILNQLYHFRTFINFYYQPQENEYIVKKAEYLASKIKQIKFISEQGCQLDSYQCLQGQLPMQYQNREQQQQIFQEFVRQMMILQSYLDLKTTNVVLNNQCYQHIILGILQPLNKVCEKLYNKILNSMAASEQEAEKLDNILCRNILSNSKSIYEKLCWLFFDLKMTLRIYLNNPQTVITYKQCQIISKCVGELFAGFLTQNQQQIRNNVQLLNDILSGENWKKKSRVNYIQTLDQTGAIIGQKLKIKINKDGKGYIPLNILIPLFKSIDKNFGKYVEMFTEMGKNDRNEHYRFNHQIATELQLRSLLRHRTSLDIAKKNTMNSHSKQLFRIFFLPQISLQNKSEQYRKYKLTVYYLQIKSLLTSNQFSKCIVQYLQRILLIYKNKQDPIPANNNINQNMLMQSGQEPTDFSQFDIVPIDQSEFKDTIGKLLGNYMSKITQQIYSSSLAAESVHSLHRILHSIKRQKQLPNVIPNNQDIKIQQNDIISLTSQQFAWNLIKYGHALFKKQYVQKLEQIEMAPKQEQDAEKKEQMQIDSIVKFLQSKNEESDQEMQEKQHRFQRQNRKQKSKEKEKLKKIMESPIFTFLIALSLIQKMNQLYIRKIYQQGIHLDLLKYLKIANTPIYSVQITSFLVYTLPVFDRSKPMQQNQNLIKYYSAVVQALQSKGHQHKIYVELLVKISKQLDSARQSGFEEQVWGIRSRIMNIVFDSINNWRNKSINDAVFDVFRQILTNSDRLFAQIQMEFKIKNYIFQKYEQSKKKKANHQNQVSNLVMKNIYIQVNIQNYLHNFYLLFEDSQQTFTKLSRQMFQGWKSTNKLIYSKGLDSLFKSDYLKDSFVNYRPTSQNTKTIELLVHNYTNLFQHLTFEGQQFREQIAALQTSQLKKQKIKQFISKQKCAQNNADRMEKILQSIMKQFKLLIPSLMQIQINSKLFERQISFIEWLVFMQMRNPNPKILSIIVMALNRNGLIVDYSKKIFYSQYLASKIISICIKQLRVPNQNRVFELKNVLLLICNCMLVKQFNYASSLKWGETSLIKQVQRIFTENITMTNNTLTEQQVNTCKALSKQCLYLLYKNSLNERILNKNQSYEIRQSQQFINQSLLVGAQDMKQIDPEDITKIAKYQDHDDYQYFSHGRNYSDLQDIIDLFQSTVGTRKQEVQQLKVQQKIQQQAKQLVQKRISQPLQLAKLASYYKYVKDDKLQQKVKSMIERHQIRSNSLVIPTSTLTRSLGYYTRYIKTLTTTSDKNKKKQDRLAILIKRKITQSRNILGYQLLRQAFLSSTPRNFIHEPGQQLSNYQIPTSPHNFIEQLQKIKANNQQFDKLLKQNHIKMQTNIQLQNLSTRQKRLMENESYRKLSMMGHYERSKFLLTVNQNFFETLPSEVHWNIVIQSKLLKSSKKRQELSKRDVNRRARRRMNLDEQPQQRQQRQYRRKKERKQAKIIKLLRLSEQQQPNISQQVIISQLKSLLNKQHNQGKKQEKNKIKQNKQRQSRKYNKNNITDILLQLSKDGIDRKTLNTLITILKNVNKIKMMYLSIQQQKGKQSQKRQQNIQSSSSIQKQIQEIALQSPVKSEKTSINQDSAQNLMQQFNESTRKQESRGIVSNQSIRDTITNMNRKKDSQVEEQQCSQQQRRQLMEFKIKMIKGKILRIIQRVLQTSLIDNKQLLTIQQGKSQQFYKQIFTAQQLQIIENQHQQNKNAIHHPLIFLLGQSLDNNHTLALTLIQSCKQMPQYLIQKIFNMMVAGTLPNRFYQHLEILSTNNKLKQLFNSKFSLQSPPALTLMGKILKYQFGRLDFVKQLHLQVLKNFKSSLRQFVCEILRLYSVEELQKQEFIFVEYKSLYLKIIHDLYERKQNISKNPISNILKIPNFLDYNGKLNVFRNNNLFHRVQLHDFDDPFSQIIRIDPFNLFSSSYNQLMSLTAQEIKRKIGVDYMETPDGMGIGYFRIWIQDIFNELVQSQVIIPMGNQNIYVPNPLYKIATHGDTNIFMFLGRVLALAVLQQQVYPCAFPTVLHKKLLNIQLTNEDLAELNPSYYEIINGVYKTLKQDPEYDITTFGLTFTYKDNYQDGEKTIKELKQNGKNIEVNKQNFQEYAKLVMQKLLIEPFKQQYEKIKQGFDNIIPLSTLQLFTQKDLQLLLSGVPVIDKQQFEKQINYEQYEKDDQVIRWFWEVFNESDNLLKSKIVQFVRGSSRLPYGKLKNNKIFRISKGPQNDHRLPNASTCGSSMTLPSYSSKQILKSMLTIAVLSEVKY